MSGILHILDQKRLIAPNGRNVGASMFFYVAGTLTPATIYADASLTTPLANPVVLAAGGLVPAIYLDPQTVYRRRIVWDDATLTPDDIDPYQPSLLLYGVYSAATTRADTFTGTGSQTAFILARPPGSTNNCEVFVDGVRQTPTTDYLVSGNTLTFDTAPHSAAVILAVYNENTLSEVTSVSVKDFGAVGDGVANDTTAIQTAVNAAATDGVVLNVPAGTYRLTAPVEVPAGCVIEGVSGLYMAATYTGRTVFYFDHTGRGFTCTGPSGGRAFRHLATLRNQPALISGWAPTANDFDFVTDGATDVSFDDILLVNSTKGILHTNGGGRHTHNKVWGQPFEVGIQIDEALDVVRSSAIHFWPFWTGGKTGNNFAEDWTAANGTAYYSKRNDNPDVVGLFCIFYRHGLRIGHWAGGNAGTTSRMRVFGLGCDAGGSGITIDAAANGATVSVYGMYTQGIASAGAVSLVSVAGANSDLRIYGEVDLTEANRHAIHLSGTGSAVTVDDLTINVYNKSAGGHAAVQVDSGTFALTVRGEVSIAGGVSGAASFGGAGRINMDFDQSFTPVITAATGTVTSLTSNTAVYRIRNGRLYMNGKIVINVNGTAAGDIRVSLPVNCSLTGNFVGVAKAGANACTVQPFASGSTAAINRYDGVYPGGDSTTIEYSLEYGI